MILAPYMTISCDEIVKLTTCWSHIVGVHFGEFFPCWNINQKRRTTTTPLFSFSHFLSLSLVFYINITYIWQYSQVGYWEFTEQIMGTFESFRKAYGALKDSTMVGLAKVNSEFKVLLPSFFFPIILNVNSLAFQMFFHHGIQCYVWFMIWICFLIIGFGYCYCEGHQPCWMPSQGTPCSKWVWFWRALGILVLIFVGLFKIFRFLSLMIHQFDLICVMFSWPSWLCMIQIPRWNLFECGFSWRNCALNLLVSMFLLSMHFFPVGFLVWGLIFSWFFFVSEIFSATSVVRPRSDVAYCIHALARRLAKTKNWIVISFHLTFVFVSICLIVVEHVLYIAVCIWGSSGTCLKAYSKNCSSHYCLFYKTMEQGHCTSLGLLGYRGILQAS